MPVLFILISHGSWQFGVNDKRSALVPSWKAEVKTAYKVGLAEISITKLFTPGFLQMLFQLYSAQIVSGQASLTIQREVIILIYSFEVKNVNIAEQ